MKKITITGILFIVFGVLIDQKLVAQLLTDDGQITSATFLALIKWGRIFLCTLGALILLAGLTLGPVKTRQILIRLNLVVISLLVSLVLAEVMIRVFMPTPYAVDEVDRLYQYHETLGHELMPGKTGTSAVMFEFKNQVVVSSQGLRNPEISRGKPNGFKRLAVLGDSFTANSQVAQDDVFTEIMNRELNGGWQVINFGADGYGTLQEYMVLEQKALAFDPDAVLLIFYLRNDFFDNKGIDGEINHRPLARLKLDDGFEVYNVPVPPPPQVEIETGERPWLLITDFHLYNIIRKLFVAKEDILVNYYPEVEYFKTVASESTNYDFELLKTILSAAKKTCDQRGLKFAVVFAPTILQVYEDQYWEKVRTDKKLEGEYDLNLPSRRFAGICRELNIPCLDLLPILKSYADTGEILYYQRHQHWNTQGNRRVAEALTGFIQEVF